MAVDIDALRQTLWDSPNPTTREEFLVQKDLKRDLFKAEREQCRKLHKAGYANLKKLGGQVTGGMNNGMQ